jgi:hypothetical protein
MRSKKRSEEWASRAEALAREMADASNAAGEYAVAAMVDHDDERAEVAYRDADLRVKLCRTGYQKFHHTYNPGNVKSRSLISFLTLDAGLRRMLGGITVQLSANTVASGSTDGEELEFLATVAFEGRNVAKENLDFMDHFVGATPDMMNQVNEVSQTLEAHHDQLLAMLERVEEIAQARNSGEAARENYRSKDERSVDELLKVETQRNPLAANAEWSAGVLLSSPQCIGIVTALPEGLQARTNQEDGNATIEWQYFDYFAFATEEFKVILNAGAPWSWSFAIDCENSESRTRWRQFLVDQGVTERQ